ncbi:MAG: cadherin repeat domain-containing protein, partial [Verrucomicrobiae bacterium]|nr:cadherin repeat domain-containing protein [Verrucomicrobiae bacterium]
IPASAFLIDDGDDDGDSLSKSQEAAAGTSDYDADSDGDGLSDATDFDPVVPNEAPGTPALSAASLPENVADAVVGNLSATNEAADTLAWSFASGTGDDDNGLLLLTGGMLSLAGSADFETKASYSIRVRATDSGGLSSEESFVITVVDDEVGRTAAEWHQNEFGNAPVDWEADDDHDRLSRLLEYALGASPFADSSSVVPTISWDAGVVRFEFTRRATGFHDLIYQVQSSISLDDWQAAAAHEVSVTPGPPPELEQVVMELDTPVPPGVFLRLKVVLVE